MHGAKSRQQICSVYCLYGCTGLDKDIARQRSEHFKHQHPKLNLRGTNIPIALAKSHCLNATLGVPAHFSELPRECRTSAFIEVSTAQVLKRCPLGQSNVT